MNRLYLDVETYNDIMRVCKKHVANSGSNMANANPEIKCVWLSCKNGFVTANATDGYALMKYTARVFASPDYVDPKHAVESDSFDTCIPIAPALKAVNGSWVPVCITDDGKTVSVEYGPSTTRFEKPGPCMPNIFERQDKYTKELEVEYETLYDPKKLIALLEACVNKKNPVTLKFLNDRVVATNGSVYGVLCSVRKK